LIKQYVIMVTMLGCWKWSTEGHVSWFD